MIRPDHAVPTNDEDSDDINSDEDEMDSPQPVGTNTEMAPMTISKSVPTKKTKQNKLWSKVSSKSMKILDGSKTTKSNTTATTSDNGSTTSSKSKISKSSHDSRDIDKTNLPQFHGFRLCYPWSIYQNDVKNVIKEIIAGMIISFAQVPESISFALLAFLPPIFGLHSAWFIGGCVALTGGRPGMISGATGGMGAILGPLMADPNLGINYLPYIIIFSGVVIILLGICGIGKFAKLIPQTVMVGFLNGLAIIIFMSQFHLFEHVLHEGGDDKWLTFTLCLILSIVTFLIVQFLPKLTKKIPSSLAGIAVASAIEYLIIRMAFHLHTPLIGDISEISGDWPLPFWNNPEYFDNLPSLSSSETWSKLMVPIILVTLVSIIEDAMTMDVVTELTHTKSKHLARHTKQQEIAMGVANIFAGMLSMMGGHGAIGLSMVSCHSGSTGVYRISGIFAAIFVLIIVMLASPLIDAVPASALVGIMLAVVFHTFEWYSLIIAFVSFFPRSIRLKFPPFMREYKIKRGNALVMIIVTILVVVVNLAYAVLLGIVLSCVLYTWQSGFDFHVHKEYVHKHHMRDKRRIKRFSDFHIHYHPKQYHGGSNHHGGSSHHGAHSREHSIETIDSMDPHNFYHPYSREHSHGESHHDTMHPAEIDHEFKKFQDHHAHIIHDDLDIDDHMAPLKEVVENETISSDNILNGTKLKHLNNINGKKYVNLGDIKINNKHHRITEHGTFKHLHDPRHDLLGSPLPITMNNKLNINNMISISPLPSVEIAVAATDDHDNIDSNELKKDEKIILFKDIKFKDNNNENGIQMQNSVPLKNFSAEFSALSDGDVGDGDHDDEHDLSKNTSFGRKLMDKFNSDYILVYHFEGPLFFGNCRNLLSYFSPKDDPDSIEIHLRDSYIYDFSAMNALNQVGEEYKKHGKSVHLRHINMKSHKLIAKANHLVKYFTYEKEEEEHQTKNNINVENQSRISNQRDSGGKREISRSVSLLKLGKMKQFRFGMNKRYV